MILKKRNLFNILGIDKNDENRYQKVYDYISSYDDGFKIEMFSSRIWDAEYCHARLTDDAKGIFEQFQSIAKKYPEDVSIRLFKKYMKRMGISDYTEDDWAHLAEICLQKSLEDCPILNSSSKALASYIGYIDIKNEKYREKIPNLKQFKKNYQNITKFLRNQEIIIERHLEKKSLGQYKKSLGQYQTISVQYFDSTGNINTVNFDVRNIRSMEGIVQLAAKFSEFCQDSNLKQYTIKEVAITNVLNWQEYNFPEETETEQKEHLMKSR